MKPEQVYQIETETTRLLNERKRLNNILNAINSHNAKSMLPANILEAYELDRIGQEYFDYVDSIKSELEAVNVAIKKLPRIPMKDYIAYKSK